MYNQTLQNIQKDYAEKHGCGLPLTAEQLLNAVVEWVQDNYVPPATIAEVKETADNALSLAQTNEQDIALNEQDINALNNKTSDITKGNGAYSIALNGIPANNVNGAQAFAGGYNSQSNGSSSFAFGTEAKANADNAICIADNAEVQRSECVIIGGNSYILGGDGKAYIIGDNNGIQYSVQAIIIGTNFIATKDGQILIGDRNNQNVSGNKFAVCIKGDQGSNAALSINDDGYAYNYGIKLLRSVAPPTAVDYDRVPVIKANQTDYGWAKLSDLIAANS